MQALRHLPVDIPSLKASKIGQFVAKLSERSGNASAVAGIDRGIVGLANDIYDIWAAGAAGKSAAIAASSSSASSTSAKDREKDKEKEKDSGAKRQRRDGLAGAAGVLATY